MRVLLWCLYLGVMLRRACGRIWTSHNSLYFPGQNLCQYMCLIWIVCLDSALPLRFVIHGKQALHCIRIMMRIAKKYGHPHPPYPPNNVCEWNAGSQWRNIEHLCKCNARSCTLAPPPTMKHSCVTSSMRTGATTERNGVTSSMCASARTEHNGVTSSMCARCIHALTPPHPPTTKHTCVASSMCASARTEHNDVTSSICARCMHALTPPHPPTMKQGCATAGMCTSATTERNGVTSSMCASARTEHNGVTSSMCSRCMHALTPPHPPTTKHTCVASNMCASATPERNGVTSSMWASASSKFQGLMWKC